MDIYRRYFRPQIIELCKKNSISFTCKRDRTYRKNTYMFSVFFKKIYPKTDLHIWKTDVKTNNQLHNLDEVWHVKFNKLRLKLIVLEH